MAKQKTHKATVKRFTVTKTKKVLKRVSGQDHFNARASGKVTRRKRRDRSMAKTFQKTIKVLMNEL